MGRVALCTNRAIPCITCSAPGPSRVTKTVIGAFVGVPGATLGSISDVPCMDGGVPGRVRLVMRAVGTTPSAIGLMTCISGELLHMPEFGVSVVCMVVCPVGASDAIVSTAMCRGSLAECVMGPAHSLGGLAMSVVCFTVSLMSPAESVATPLVGAACVIQGVAGSAVRYVSTVMSLVCLVHSVVGTLHRIVGAVTCMRCTTVSTVCLAMCSAGSATGPSGTGQGRLDVMTGPSCDAVSAVGVMSCFADLTVKAVDAPTGTHSVLPCPLGVTECMVSLGVCAVCLCSRAYSR